MSLLQSCSSLAYQLTVESMHLESQYDITNKVTEYFNYTEKNARVRTDCVDRYEYKLGTIADVMKLLGISTKTAVKVTKELWEVGILYKKSQRSGFYVTPYLIRKEGINKTKQFCDTEYFKNIRKKDHELKRLT